MIERTIKKYLLKVFKQYPVVTITGPRQSGKTTLCRAAFPHLPYVNLEALDQRQFATEDPRGFLAQFPDGVILDEFQRTPDLPSYIQTIVDEDGRNGLFVLTGSQNLALANTVSQSLAGRTAVLTLLPLSVSEILSTKIKPCVNDLIFFGGYPRIYDKKIHPFRALADYTATYIERDIRELRNIESSDKFFRFMQLCAGRISQLINYESLANEVGVSGPTIKKWIGLLEATYIAFNLPPYWRNISKRVVKSPKFYFYDVGLACYFLGVRSSDQLLAHPLRGALFENLVVSECLKQLYNVGLDNRLLFFRDSAGNEVDIVVDLGVSPILIEVKASQTLTKAFTKGFKAFEKAGITPSSKILVYEGEKKGKAFDFEATDVYSLEKTIRKLIGNLP